MMIIDGEEKKTNYHRFVRMGFSHHFAIPTLVRLHKDDRRLRVVSERHAI